MTIVRLLFLAFLIQVIPTSRFSVAGQRDLHIIRDGKTDYRIVIPRNATPVEQKAASELQHYLREISGVELPLVSDSALAGGHSILIGATTQTARLVRRTLLDSLEADGFLIQTVGRRLIICGGLRKGTLFGVNTLLERYLGCRKYTAVVELVPRSSTVTLPVIRTVLNPFFRFREIYYLNAMDRGYSDWHKLHSLSDQQEEWGMWVHTFGRLVPASEFYANSPEYFSLQGGRRIPTGQLCLSNPQVFQLLVQRLRDLINRQPAARYWSVSQNDNFNECQCEGCLALNARFGGSSGTMVDFVNRVAAQFPDRSISTLAYQYTRSAPTGVRPARNVNIMFCSIECNRSEPIPSDPRSASFRKDMEGWSRLTDNILLWDYVVQFRNLVSPFPNLRVLQPNIQYFARHNVRLMFQQGCGANVGEFGELRTYLIAKLLWDPMVNLDTVMNDFLNGYYGAAGTFLRRYIDIMHDALAGSGKILDIYGYPYDAIDSYLTPELIKTYSGLFDEAERAVQHLPEVLERVKNARLPLEFAILDISLHDPTRELSYFDKEGEKWTVRPSMLGRLEDFVAQAKKAGIERLEEGGTSPDDYRRSVGQLLRVSVEGNIAFGKPVTLLTTPSEKYPAGGGAALTNGLHGPSEYHCNWLGFEGEHCKAIIDLQEVKTIRAIKTTFLQMWYAWIWLPLEVKFSISSDGESYFPVATIPNAVPDTTGGSFTKSFDAAFAPVQARFIKIEAPSRLVCPDWHIGAGQKSWLFIDEIVVE